jgi:tripartite motif-containing protein 71
VIPEPKAPTPAPPVTIFREAVGGFGIGTGSFDGPVDIAVDAEGNFFVLDAGNNRVQMFDNFSNFVLTLGSYGSRKGDFSKPEAIAEFSKPEAIAIDPEGSLFVVDTGNHRIQKFVWVDKSACPECPARANGKRLKFHSSWGSLGSRSGDFKAPRDIAFDADGNSYVLDAGNQRVQSFDSSEHFIGEWGRLFGSRGGIFTDLVSIAWSAERLGYVYLLGAGCLVQQFQLDGTLVSSWPAIAPETGLCVPGRIEIDNKNHFIHVLDSGNGLFERYYLDGRFLFALRGAERPFSKPLGLAVNTDREEFLVADTENNIVQKFTLR